MIAFIINYNRLTLPVAMAEWLSERGCVPVFIDNNSNYQPLLDYYQETHYAVVRMRANLGHTVMWSKDGWDILNDHVGKKRYIVTDGDLDLSAVPDDFLKVLNRGLDKYDTFDKCALSLEINDLPDTKEGNYIREHEAKYWMNALDDEYFYADTDTTLAMYRGGIRRYSHCAIRTNRPYTARHVPWYYDKFSYLSEEDQNYLLTANDSCSGKKRFI